MARTPSTRFVFRPVQLVRPAEVVAYRIAEAIRAGDVKVGERLPSEQNLSQQLGVARPTLREAVKLLVQAGVLNVLPGASGGNFVISQSVPANLAGMPLPELPMEDIASVMEARRLVEPHISRMAAAYGTPADFVAMREAVALSAETGAAFRDSKISADGLELMTLASTRFSISVARATQNSVLVQMMDLLLRRTEPVRVLALAQLDDVLVSTRTLQASLEAIESGDPERIDQATFDRIGLLEATWERVTGRPLRRRPRLVVAAFDGRDPGMLVAPSVRGTRQPRKIRKTPSTR